MGDLINRQNLLELIDWYEHQYSEIESYLDIIRQDIKSLPSAQKTGKWIVNSPVTMKCDQCGYVMADWKCKESNYCPHCGCRMVGEEE